MIVKLCTILSLTIAQNCQIVTLAIAQRLEMSKERTWPVQKKAFLHHHDPLLKFLHTDWRYARGQRRGHLKWTAENIFMKSCTYKHKMNILFPRRRGTFQPPLVSHSQKYIKSITPSTSIMKNNQDQKKLIEKNHEIGSDLSLISALISVGYSC